MTRIELALQLGNLSEAGANDALMARDLGRYREVLSTADRAFMVEGTSA